jgi:hypothetical protein
LSIGGPAVFSRRTLSWRRAGGFALDHSYKCRIGSTDLSLRRDRGFFLASRSILLLAAAVNFAIGLVLSYFGYFAV